MSNNRGRKPKIYSQEIIDRIIYLYTQEFKGQGLVKYLDVYRFSNDLYNQGKIDIKFSEDFWRKSGRQGKESIDKANEIYLYSPLPLDDSQIEKIVDTLDAVEKFFDGKKANKEKLVGALLINENKLKDYIKKYCALEEKLLKKEQEIQKLKTKNTDLMKKTIEYERLFFTWLDASSDPNVQLINLITTGKTRNKIVNKLFEIMFSDDPLKGFNEFELFRAKKSNKSVPTDKVTPITKNKNTLLDDLGL